MIPRWQMLGIIAAVLLAALGEIYLNQNSYAHAYLWGECAKDPALAACHPLSRGFVGPRGVR
jgi:hypothetical protein